MGDIAQAIVWIAVLALLTAILLVPSWLRHKTRIAVLKVIAEASAKGQSFDPAILEQLAAGSKSNLSRWFTFICLFCGPGPLALGIVLGIATGLFGGQLGFDEATRKSLLIPALYSGGSGLGFTFLGFLSLRLFPPNRDT